MRSDDDEEFQLRVNRTGIIELSRGMFLTSYAKTINLVRVDLVTRKAHTNPDGVKIEEPHIHLYREGYNLRWAYPLKDIIPVIDPNEDITTSFKHFCDYCHIRLGGIQQSLG